MAFGEIRYPPVILGLGIGIGLGSLYGALGAFSPEALPSFIPSTRALAGMALMLTPLPAYLVPGSIILHRRGLGLIDKLRSELSTDSLGDSAELAIGSGWGPRVAIGTSLGLVMGLLNAPILNVFDVSGAVGIAGAMAFVPLQSLDAAFRWYNYGSALAVAIPASAFILFWPLAPLHRRIRLAKEAQLKDLETAISEAVAEPKADVATFEPLISHRDRVRRLGTWLLSTQLVSRIVLYLVIPPLVWVGAALVERFVNAFIGS
jgi:hypothetical protein